MTACARTETVDRSGRTWSAAAKWHADESGFMTMTHLVCVMFFALVGVWLLNIARQTTDAPHRQGAADAAAAAAVQWVEHGLNELSALNHTIGETASFIVLHEALVGPLPPRGTAADRAVEQRLAEAVAARLATGQASAALSVMQQPIAVGGAIGRAQRRLKQGLAELYEGSLSGNTGGTSTAARAAANLAQERNLAAEYEWLRGLEQQTLALQREVREFERTHLPRLDRQARQLVADTPRVAAAAAEALVGRHQLTGGVVPFALPVQRDPLARLRSVPSFPAALYADWSPLRKSGASPALSADEVVTRTQLARAAWPWVLYHSLPIRDRLRRHAPHSGAAHDFDQELFEAGVAVCRRLAEERNIALYLLREATPLAKGHERWTGEATQTDRIFAVVGWAAAPHTALQGEPALFRNSHPQGRLALAQGLVFNANPQEPRRGVGGSLQPRVGWDTLAWAYRAGEEPHEMTREIPPAPPFPRIAVNWRSLLVPVSPEGLAQARKANSLPAEFRPILNRLDPAFPRPLQTH